MRSKVIRIGVAVVLAAVGAVVLIRYVESARDEAVAAEAVVDVYVVDQPIPKGTTGADLQGLVHQEQVPVKVRAEDAVTDLSTIATLHAGVALVKGEQLVQSRFVTAGEAARGAAPDGLLRITIALDPERALGGFVRPGDKVRVVLTGDDPATAGSTGSTASRSTTNEELSNIVVTKVQGQPLASDSDPASGGVDPVPSGTYFITLAADAATIDKIATAKVQNRIWLSVEPDQKPATAPVKGSGS